MSVDNISFKSVEKLKYLGTEP